MDLKGKKVLVTGADGFIGSHLTEALVNAGASVRALALYNSFNDWGWLEKLPCLDEVEVVTGDVRDPWCCRRISEGREVIFHLAALIAIPFSYRAPQSYVETNVSGTLNMCQAALEHGVERMIHTSTSEVYGSALRVPIDETHPLQPQSPYSATKIGADAIALSHYYSFNLPLTVARPFNTYGPRQSARAVIPNIIAQLSAGRLEVDLGDLTTTRDFNYAVDTCRGFMALACSGETVGEVVNIGSGREISIGGLFETICRLMGSQAAPRHDPQRMRPAASEVQRLLCDNAKIKRLAGFEPAYSLEDGLAKTIEWFSEPANLARYKTGIYNV